MLGHDTIILLLLIGVLVVLVPFIGGLRGLFTPDVTPFFLRKKRTKDEPAEPKSQDESSSAQQPDKRKAA